MVVEVTETGASTSDGRDGSLGAMVRVGEVASSVKAALRRVVV